MTLDDGVFLSGTIVMALFTLFCAFTIYEARQYNPHAFKREAQDDSPDRSVDPIRKSS